MAKGKYPVSVQPGIPKLGLCPAGWRTVKFNDVLHEVTRPVKLEDHSEYQLVVAKRSRGGIESRGKLLGSKILTKTQFRIEKDDFLISNRQIVHGACGVVPENLSGAIVSNEYTVLHPTDDLHLDFLKYLAHTIYFQQTCFHSSVGIDVEKMIFRLNDWLKRSVHLPKLNEQKKISEIFSTWDEAISKLSALLERLHLRKQYLMNKTFKRCVFNRLQDNPYENTANLGDLFLERKETKCIDLPLLSITSSNGVVPRNMLEKKDTSNNDKSKYLRIASGDIGYNTMRMWQGVSALSQLEGIVSPAYTICIPTEKIDAVYFSYLFKYTPMIYIFWRHSQGLVDDTLNLKFDAFSKIKVAFPDREKQQEISRHFIGLDKEISLAKQLREKIESQKFGLMQQLLVGKIRVKI